MGHILEVLMILISGLIEKLRKLTKVEDGEMLILTIMLTILIDTLKSMMIVQQDLYLKVKLM